MRGDRPVAPTKAGVNDGDVATGRSLQRRSIRLRGYDYAQAGAYFVTICTHDRECLFGEIMDGKMVLNDVGRMVADEWMKTAQIRAEIELDEWVVMPNHIHGILVITDDCCRGDRLVAPRLVAHRLVAPTSPSSADSVETTITGAPHTLADSVETTINTAPPVSPMGPTPKSISALIAGFKSAATKRVNEFRGIPGARLWQRNYWEHIIRNDSELNRIREYIRNNPAQWESDQLYAPIQDDRG